MIYTENVNGKGFVNYFERNDINSFCIDKRKDRRSYRGCELS